MSCDKRRLHLIALIAVICFLSHIPVIEAASNKILVVMSYEEDNPWCRQIKEGIDSVLAGNSDIKYFYMDTKKNINGGVRKAKKDSPSGRAIRKQVEIESDTYLTKFAGFKLVQTIKETLVALEAYQKASDALFITSTNGILDAHGNSLDNDQVTKIVAKFYKKPLIGANNFHVKYGVLCAVVKSGNAQGRIAAELLVKAMKGTPINQIAITVNKYGKRMLNVTVMKDLGIRPKRRVLVGTKLVKTSGNIK